MAMQIESAMLLCAGLGTRMRPITLTTPKPLLPMDGGVLIDHQLRYLASFGIKRVAINLHHLGQMIRDHVGSGSKYKLEIFYSMEPEILGTGGGIKGAARFFGRTPFVAMNSDALLAADLSLVAEKHFESDADATMVVQPLPEICDYTPISISDDGVVTGFGQGSHFYTGLSILGPAIFDVLPPSGQQACLVRDGIATLIERKGKVAACTYEGYFNDLGTPERYEEARRDIAEGKFKLLIP